MIQEPQWAKSPVKFKRKFACVHRGIEGDIMSFRCKERKECLLRRKAGKCRHVHHRAVIGTKKQAR